jgi:hypothetical protein
MQLQQNKEISQAAAITLHPLSQFASTTRSRATLLTVSRLLHLRGPTSRTTDWTTPATRARGQDEAAHGGTGARDLTTVDSVCKSYIYMIRFGV